MSVICSTNSVRVINFFPTLYSGTSGFLSSSGTKSSILTPSLTIFFVNPIWPISLFICDISLENASLLAPDNCFFASSKAISLDTTSGDDVRERFGPTPNVFNASRRAPTFSRIRCSVSASILPSFRILVAQSLMRWSEAFSPAI